MQHGDKLLSLSICVAQPGVLHSYKLLAQKQDWQ